MYKSINAIVNKYGLDLSQKELANELNFLGYTTGKNLLATFLNSLIQFGLDLEHDSI